MYPYDFYFLAVDHDQTKPCLLARHSGTTAVLVSAIDEYIVIDEYQLVLCRPVCTYLIFSDIFLLLTVTVKNCFLNNVFVLLLLSLLVCREYGLCVVKW